MTCNFTTLIYSIIPQFTVMYLFDFRTFSNIFNFHFCFIFIQFSSQRQQQQQQQHQHHQHQEGINEQEFDWNFDFMESTNFLPTSTFGWIGYGLLMLMGMILFIILSTFATLFNISPHFAIFLVVFFIFLAIFSPGILCCSRKTKIQNIKKEDRPKCVVQPRNKEKENERHLFDDVYQQNENDVPIYENHLLGKDRICVVCRTEQSVSNALILRNKYRKDPLLFCRSKILFDSILSDETSSDLNINDNDNNNNNNNDDNGNDNSNNKNNKNNDDYDNNDNGDVRTNSKSTQLNSNTSDVIAIVGRAVRWAEYSSPHPRNIPENIPKSILENVLQPDLISNTSSTIKSSESSSTEEYSSKNVLPNASGNFSRNNDIDDFDSWLNKLLCGQIVDRKSVV